MSYKTAGRVSFRPRWLASMIMTTMTIVPLVGRAWSFRCCALLVTSRRRLAGASTTSPRRPRPPPPPPSPSRESGRDGGGRRRGRRGVEIVLRGAATTCVSLPSNDDDGGDVDRRETIARDLARRLNLPLVSNDDDDDDDDGARGSSSWSHVLRVVPYRSYGIDTHALAVASTSPTATRRTRRRSDDDATRRRSASSTTTTVVDLLSTADRRRGGGDELLLKATGGPRSSSSWACDLTAGLGRDSIVLASRFERVRMVERDPVVGALLEDALRRARLAAVSGSSSSPEDVARASLLSARLDLVLGDGANFSIDDDDRPDVCYLDPMFPPRRKTAAVKKDMRVLHGLLSSQTDDETQEDRSDNERRLLETALRYAKRRVVVKRPKGAPPLGRAEEEDSGTGSGAATSLPKPSHEIKGSFGRFDVYMIT